MKRKGSCRRKELEGREASRRGRRRRVSKRQSLKKKARCVISKQEVADGEERKRCEAEGRSLHHEESKSMIDKRSLHHEAIGWFCKKEKFQLGWTKPPYTLDLYHLFTLIGPHHCHSKRLQWISDFHHSTSPFAHYIRTACGWEKGAWIHQKNLAKILPNSQLRIYLKPSFKQTSNMSRMMLITWTNACNLSNPNRIKNHIPKSQVFSTKHENGNFLNLCQNWANFTSNTSQMVFRKC